jgi:hypothetical protein
MSETDSSLAGIVPDPLQGVKDFLSSDAGLLAAAGLGALVGGDMSTTPPTGYQGSIPDYTAVRTAVPNTFDASRRPGSGGRRYFSDIQFVPTEGEGAAQALQTAQTAAATQAAGLETLNKNNPAFEAIPTYQYLTPTAEIAAATAPASSVATTTQQMPIYGLDALTEYLGSSPFESPYEAYDQSLLQQLDKLKLDLAMERGEIPSSTYQQGTATGMAMGGIAELSKGRYLDGKTDGMADKVPARIDGVQEARLSDGEFVIPADVVSHLGNGNSDAGAKVLEDMMARVRKARTGNTKQGKEINPRDFLPA